MKKTVINLVILSAIFFAATACGGKEMNDPADGSGSGPSYLNESELPHNRGKDTCDHRKH